MYKIPSHNLKQKYCKRGYFRWGEISRKRWQDISRGGNCHETTPIPFINAYGFYFRMGIIFAKTTKARKMQKIPPRENIHVYSITRGIPLSLYRESVSRACIIWPKVTQLRKEDGCFLSLKYHWNPWSLYYIYGSDKFNHVAQMHVVFQSTQSF